MTKLNAARERTGKKLRYAGIHLSELKVKRVLARADGDAWERAHQESFLFHLLGVRDALLQEMNLFHNVGLSMENVKKWTLAEKLKKMGIPSPALEVLVNLEADQTSWISIASRFRHYSTHQKNIPRQYVIDGANNDPVFPRDPLTGDLIKKDFTQLMDEWHANMEELVEDLRTKMSGAENG